MLTGKRPFEGRSLVDALGTVLHQNPPPLSGSREFSFGPRHSKWAMAKRVEDRYSSAREMLQALESVSLSGSTAVAPRTRTVSRIIVMPFRAPTSDDQIDFLNYSLPPDAISNSSAMDNLIVRSTLLQLSSKGSRTPNVWPSRRTWMLSSPVPCCAQGIAFGSSASSSRRPAVPFSGRSRQIPRCVTFSCYSGRVVRTHPAIAPDSARGTRTPLDPSRCPGQRQSLRVLSSRQPARHHSHLGQHEPRPRPLSPVSGREP